jgi:hypothetical protein
MDFIKPTPSVGYSSHYSIGATERLQCDMVLALNLANRLESENHFSLDLIAEGLSAFSKRWLVVEFDGRESRPGDEAGDDKFKHLPLHHFIGALRKRFSGVRVISPGGEQSVWLVCEK